MSNESGEPMAWIIAALGVWVLVSPFVFGIAGGVRTALAITGVVVAALAAWRAVKPDEKVPLPFLPLVVILFGLFTIASPFLLGIGLGVHGITLLVSGIAFVVMPAMMINRMLNEEARQAGGTAGS